MLCLLASEGYLWVQADSSYMVLEVYYDLDSVWFPLMYI